MHVSNSWRGRTLDIWFVNVLLPKRFSLGTIYVDLTPFGFARALVTYRGHGGLLVEPESQPPES